MEELSRRDFLASAALAGASVATARPLAHAQGANTGEGVNDVDPSFVSGTVAEVTKTGEIVVRDPDSKIRALRLVDGSRAWKAGAWNATELQSGDCLYARGELGAAEGLLEVDRAWANIVSFPGTVLKSTSDELAVSNEKDGDSTVRLTPSTEIQAESGEFHRGSSEGLSIGTPVQVIAFFDPETGAETASRVLNFGGPSALGDDDEDTPREEGGCKIWDGLTTWFCCGGQGGCGNRCGAASGGACGDCRADRNHMAWPKLSTGCGPFCADCCVNQSVDRLNCDRDLFVYSPCSNPPPQVGVKVKDCGPTVRCNVDRTGCLQLKKVKFDLTPCAFTHIGNLNDGLRLVNVRKC